MVSWTSSFASAKDDNPKNEPITYYGVIKDIFELDYYGNLKFVMFKCDSFEVEEDKYRLTSVYFNRKVYQNDPFVLAFQVQQCFYIKDPLDANRHYAFIKVPRDLFNIGDQCDQSNGVEVNATNNVGELNWVRKDMPVTIFHKPSTIGEEITFPEDDIDETLFDSMD